MTLRFSFAIFLLIALVITDCSLETNQPTSKPLPLERPNILLHVVFSDSGI